jgi:hypothetical protein
MARTSRVRLRTLPLTSGSLHVFDSANGFTVDTQNTSPGSFAFKSQCNDSVGRPLVDSELTIIAKNNSYLVPLNGTHVISPTATCVLKDYFPDTLRDGTWLLTSIPDGMPSEGSSMTDLFARTNPSRPDYVPLTLLQDLIDIPKQLKDVGRLIRSPRRILSPKEQGSQYLGYQFGWRPLVEDVKNLLDLQSHIHQRVGELNRLKSDSGLKRTLHLGRWASEYERRNLFVESGSGFFSFAVNHYVHTDVERWGTIRWKPSSIPGHNPKDADTIAQAKRIVSGLSLEALQKGAWDLLPWSWIVDWFGNIGNYCLINSNTVPAFVSSACIMTKTSSTNWYVPVISSFPTTGGGGKAYYTTKRRYVGAPSLDVHLPFIGKDRLAILGALFVQRFK